MADMSPLLSNLQQSPAAQYSDTHRKPCWTQQYEQAEKPVAAQQSGNATSGMAASDVGVAPDGTTRAHAGGSIADLRAVPPANSAAVDEGMCFGIDGRSPVSCMKDTSGMHTSTADAQRHGDENVDMEGMHTPQHNDQRPSNVIDLLT